jgi:hypothetical protein
MKIIKDMEIKVEKVYFTISVAVVLFIIIAGCVSTHPHTTPSQTTSQTTPPPIPATSLTTSQKKLLNKTFRPISVNSVQPGCAYVKGVGCNPGGPAFTVTLNASSTDVPVTHLSAMLVLTELQTNFSISFTFPDINKSNPLMPGQTASETSGAVVGPVYVLNVNGTAAVFIEGTLQNGKSFSYWTNETQG